MTCLQNQIHSSRLGSLTGLLLDATHSQSVAWKFAFPEHDARELDVFIIKVGRKEVHFCRYFVLPIRLLANADIDSSCVVKPVPIVKFIPCQDNALYCFFMTFWYKRNHWLFRKLTGCSFFFLSPEMGLGYTNIRTSTLFPLARWWCWSHYRASNQ